ncbi:MAG TPA: hypothetical protein VD995_06175 [Azospirillum sp.]|nr:hypothetical protein [Azospirillum sp.]
MSRFLSLAAAVFMLAFAGQPAHAYCVYNHTDGWKLRVEQTLGGNFKQEVGEAKGSRACCAWNDPSCNRSLLRNAPVELWVGGDKGTRTADGRYQGLNGTCGVGTNRITVEAGGWVEVYSGQNAYDRGDIRAFHCIAYSTDGKVTGVVTK